MKRCLELSSIVLLSEKQYADFYEHMKRPEAPTVKLLAGAALLRKLVKDRKDQRLGK